MKKLSVCVFFICFIFCGPALAEDIKIGFASYFALYDIDDPNGSSDSYSGLQPINVVFAMPLSNSTRFFVEAGLVDFEVDGSISNIANDVSGYRLAAAYQYKIRAARDLHFWVGAGPEISQLDFEKRYTLTNDGFLDSRFPDRSETTIAAYFNVSSEWEINDKFDLGFNAAYKYGFGDSVSGLNVGLTAFYRFGD